MLATRRQDGDAPDYYVPSNFVYPFNISNTVVWPLINQHARLVLPLDSVQATHDRTDKHRF